MRADLKNAFDSAQQAVASMRMLYSYKDKRHGVAYVSPVLALLAVTLAAVMFVDNTDLIFASGCEEETAESFIDKVQDGVTDSAKTVMATGGRAT